MTNSTNRNQSLNRGLQILEAYTPDKPSWGIRELGRMLGVNAATTQRLVATMADLGYLKKNVETQKYHLGPKVVLLAKNYSTQNSLTQIALRVFEKYGVDFPYNFYLGVMTSHEVVYIAVQEARGPLKISHHPGETVSLTGSAIGKMLLACRSDEFIQRLLVTHPLEKVTPHSVTSERALMRQIKEIRKLGYAINKGEIYEEIAAVAAPITSPNGSVVAGLSVAFPLHYLELGKLDLDEIVRITVAAADEVTLINAQSAID
jgi:DNA-binding IclR family transcriptional regulator